MKLNDPFGRMARRNEREYDSLATSLQSAGMTDPQQAEDLLVKLEKRTRTGLSIIIPAALVLLVLFRDYWMFIAAFTLLICIWLIKTTQKARVYIRRYVDEYLTEPKAEPAVTEADSEADTKANTEIKPAAGNTDSTAEPPR